MSSKPRFVGDRQLVELGSICELVMGQSPSSDTYNADGEGLPFYQGNADFGEKTPIPHVWCTEPKKVAEKGDILISVRAPIGAINIARERCCIGRGVAAIRPMHDFVSADFLMHQLLASRKKLELMGTGSTFKAVGKKALNGFAISIYPKGDQDKIADQLDCIIQQIKAAETQVTQLDQLVKSRFVEMFGDTYLNSMAWDSCKLGELISFMTSGSRGWARYYSDDGEYFLTIKNVKKCKVDVSGVQHVIAPVGKESVRTKVQENDVLISITADLGRTGVVTKEIADHGAYINQHLACIRLTDDSVDPVFLSHFLESPGGIDQFAKKNQNGVKAGLNFNLIRSLEIQMPPLVLQQEFAAFASQVDKSRFIAQQQIEKLQMLYDSLAQDYFGD